jgi:hypothetical protein
MARQVKKTSQRGKKKSVVEWNFPIEKKNWVWFFVGIGVIVLGYILMTTGITEEPALPQGKWNNPLVIYVAPVIIVIGYCVIIPYAILKTFKKEQ